MSSINHFRVVVQDLYAHENKDPGDALLTQAKQYAAAEQMSGFDVCRAHQLFAGSALHLR